MTPLARMLGHRWGITAQPGGRRQHAGIVSKLGALPIYVAFVGAVLLSQLFVFSPSDAPSSLPAVFTVIRFDPKEVIRIIGLLISGTIVFVVGLIDDWKDLPPIPQYTAQMIAAGIAIIFWIMIEYISNPFTGSQTPDFDYLVTVVISLFWLVFMTNTVNWLDGLDGLSAGVSAIACVILIINAIFRLSPPQHSVAIFPIALLGATLGFLPYNFYPAKVFLGSGALFLGYMLGILSIIGGAKMASILMVMGLPLLDVVWQIVRRVAHGKNPGIGDRGHLHFRLQDMGIPMRRIVLGYYAFCAIFGGLTLFIPSQLYKLVAMLIMIAICVLGFFWLAKKEPLADRDD